MNVLLDKLRTPEPRYAILLVDGDNVVGIGAMTGSRPEEGGERGWTEWSCLMHVEKHRGTWLHAVCCRAEVELNMLASEERMVRVVTESIEQWLKEARMKG